MLREIILPIFKSTRLCVTVCGIMHQRCCRPVAQWDKASSSRLHDHTQDTTTVGRTPLDKLSGRRRNLHLTTHNTHDRHPCPRRDWTRIASMWPAADPRLRTRGHWDRTQTNTARTVRWTVPHKSNRKKMLLTKKTLERPVLHFYQNSKYIDTFRRTETSVTKYPVTRRHIATRNVPYQLHVCNATYFRLFNLQAPFVLYIRQAFRYSR